jgi:hypothetical protein
MALHPALTDSLGAPPLADLRGIEVEQPAEAEIQSPSEGAEKVIDVATKAVQEEDAQMVFAEPPPGYPGLGPFVDGSNFQLNLGMTAIWPPSDDEDQDHFTLAPSRVPYRIGR